MLLYITKLKGENKITALMAQTEKSVKKRKENKNKIVALNGMSWISFNPKYNKRKIRMGVFRVEASYLLEIEERCPLYVNGQFL